MLRPVAAADLLVERLSRESRRRAIRDPVDLGTFITRSSPTYVRPYWLESVLEVYQAIAAGEELRVLLEAPPRHGKTDLTLAAIAWLLSTAPERTHAFTTYADALARSKSRKARRLAREAGVAISDESASVNEWRTTDEGGLLATGVGGPLTGHGITGVGVIDDPFKNRRDADSRLIRDRVWDWYTDTFYTRLEPGASVIVQHTRWHPDDLIGRLVGEAGYQRIRLPAIAEDPDDPLGRAIGEALWPDRFSVEKLRQIEETVGSYTFASLYQQRPRPRGEELFRAPTFYDPTSGDVRRTLASGYRAVAGMDAAYAAKTKSDASAIVEARVVDDPFDGRPVAYVTRVLEVRERVTAFGKRLEQLEAPYIRWRLAGAEAGTADFLEDTFRVRLVCEAAVTDKFAYAQPAAAAWNAGRIRLPQEPGRPLDRHVAALVDQARSFTGEDDPHDDLVDATASMWAEASEGYPSEEAARALTGH
ncbi:terminase large subunit domain-containing protein [Natronococcus sp.]|uniref:terminase large subunit domain-containing protein n=1 Tax=Natronococcus sp. TaxID=35747 RepID=UPI003A4DE64C